MYGIVRAGVPGTTIVSVGRGEDEGGAVTCFPPTDDELQRSTQVATACAHLQGMQGDVFGEVLVEGGRYVEAAGVDAKRGV